MENISFILGSGFSKPAGYPLSKEINDKIINGIAQFTFRTSEGTWKWIEKNGTTHPLYSQPTSTGKEQLLLDSFIELYQKETFLPFNYEEFYDWFTKIKNKGIRKEDDDDYLSNAYSLVPSLQKSNNVLDCYAKVNSCFHFLVQDLLLREDEKLLSYNFLKTFLTQNSKANFFTLNHDILLENLFDSWGFEYSDGFSKEHDILKFLDQPVSMFKDDFSKDFKIYKLHGSVDYYRRPQKEVNIEDFMIKSRNLMERLYTKATQTEDFILDLTKDRLAPEFLTGKTKFNDKNLGEPKCFVKLFDHYQTKLPKSSTIIIIGYSYMDTHINKILKNAIDSSNKINIININPFQEFPFKRNGKFISIENFRSQEILETYSPLV